MGLFNIFDPDKMYEYREMIIEQLNVIETTKENLHLLKEEDIMFIEVSNEGTHYIMDKDTNLYYIKPGIKTDDVFKYLPEYKQASLENQKMYKAINLGLGHALLIKTFIYDEYMKLLKTNIQYENEFEDCYNAYCHWIDNAILFLK